MLVDTIADVVVVAVAIAEPNAVDLLLMLQWVQQQLLLLTTLQVHTTATVGVTSPVVAVKHVLRVLSVDVLGLSTLTWV